MTTSLLAKRIFKSENISIASLRALAFEQRKALGITCTVHDENSPELYDKKGPYIFVLLNQTSLVESLLIPEVAPINFFIFANVGYLLFPFVGWLAAATSAIPVLPGWRWQTKYAVKEACARLLSNPQQAMYMSIEGRRSPDGFLSTYRLGCARMAIETRATIVPIVIHGARECLPYGHYRLRPGHCVVKLLAAVPPAQWDAVSLTQHLRSLAQHELPASVPAS